MGKLVYIADDEDNIRELIKSFLEKNEFSVVVFENGDELLAEFINKPCDLIILDIMMKGTDGFSICKQIREESKVPIIIVSAKDSEADRIKGITLGSDDYLVKPFSLVELVVRVKAIFRRIDLEKTQFNPEYLHFGDIKLLLNTRQIILNNSIIDITPTEFSFMAYMFLHKDRAVSRDELLKNIWKFDVSIDTRVIDDTLKRLRKKLKGSNVCIEAVWGFGFKLALEDKNEVNKE